jgi:hypothetical protein
VVVGVLLSKKIRPTVILCCGRKRCSKNLFKHKISRASKGNVSSTSTNPSRKAENKPGKHMTHAKINFVDSFSTSDKEKNTTPESKSHNEEVLITSAMNENIDDVSNKENIETGEKFVSLKQYYSLILLSYKTELFGKNYLMCHNFKLKPNVNPQTIPKK